MNKIRFASEDLKLLFKSLNNSRGEDKIIYRNLVNAFIKIESNPTSGIQIPKNLIPKYYINKYKLKNLWKYNMPEGWRLLYSIKGEGILIISIIIEWLPHKAYEKRFKY